MENRSCSQDCEATIMLCKHKTFSQNVAFLMAFFSVCFKTISISSQRHSHVLLYWIIDFMFHTLSLRTSSRKILPSITVLEIYCSWSSVEDRALVQVHAFCSFFTLRLLYYQIQTVFWKSEATIQVWDVKYWYLRFNLFFNLFKNLVFKFKFAVFYLIII